MILIDTIINAVNNVIDKIVPDANVREQVKSQIAAQAFEWAKLDASDRDSARKREIETKDTTTRELAYIYTIGYFGALGSLLFGLVHIPEGYERLVDVLFGVLTAGQYSVMTYYFGSSHSSRSKDDTIGIIVKNGHGK